MIGAVAEAGSLIPLYPFRWLLLVPMKLLCICLLSLVLHVSLVSADPHPSSPQLPDTVPTEVELADPTMATTPEKRHQLLYLVRCALPKQIVLYTQQGTERFTFPGQMGLA